MIERKKYPGRENDFSIWKIVDVYASIYIVRSYINIYYDLTHIIIYIYVNMIATELFTSRNCLQE